MILQKNREIINSIKLFGHKVVILGDDRTEESVWVFTEFKEANGKTRFFHSLFGKDITKLVVEEQQIVDKDVLYHKIEGIQAEEVWIHADTKFMVFINQI